MSRSQRDHPFEANGLLLVLLTLSLLLMLSSRTAPGRVIRQSVTSFTASLFSPFLFIPESFTIWENNQALARRNIDLVLENARLQTRLESTEQILSLQGLGGRDSLKVTPARVVSRSDGSYFHRLQLIFDPDTAIAGGAPVIAPDGLAGKVVNANDHSATAILLNDPDFRVRAKLADSGVEGIVYFDLDQMAFKIKNIPLSHTPTLGEEIRTSGLASIFPANIPIGRVTAFETTPGLFWDMRLEPFVELRALYTVGIVSPMNGVTEP